MDDSGKQENLRAAEVIIDICHRSMLRPTASGIVLTHPVCEVFCSFHHLDISKNLIRGQTSRIFNYEADS